MVAAVSKTSGVNLGFDVSESRYIADQKIDIVAKAFGFQWPSLEFINLMYKEMVTKNGVFSIKLQWPEFKYLNDQFGKDNERVFAQLFPNSSYIYLRRRSVVKQAVSMRIATMTGDWGDRGGGVGKSREGLHYNYNTLLSDCLKLLDYERSWKAFFTKYSIQFMELYYEDFICDFEETIKSILEFCDIEGLSKPVGDCGKMKKQSNALNQEWIARFLADLEDDPKHKIDLCRLGL